MTSLSASLIRIEYKLDLIMAALQSTGQMLPPGDLPKLEEQGHDICPACGARIRFHVDYANEAVIRTCGCAVPVHVVQGISALLKPQNKEKTHAHAHPEDSLGHPDEDGAPDVGGQDLPGPRQ